MALDNTTWKHPIIALQESLSSPSRVIFLDARTFHVLQNNPGLEILSYDRCCLCPPYPQRAAYVLYAYCSSPTGFPHRGPGSAHSRAATRLQTLLHTFQLYSKLSVAIDRVHIRKVAQYAMSAKFGKFTEVAESKMHRRHVKHVTCRTYFAHRTKSSGV